MSDLEKRAWPSGSWRCSRLVPAVVVLALAGCANDEQVPERSDPAAFSTIDATTPVTEPSTEPGDTDPAGEYRDTIGPRAVDLDQSMAMVVDGMAITDDGDVVVATRVSNFGEGVLDLGVRDTIYGPLMVMRDDRNQVYEGLAVEPAGIPGNSIGLARFRLAGPVDPTAMSFTLELATQRGTLASTSFEAPTAFPVLWRTETRLAVPDGRDAPHGVTEVVDRGTHLDISLDPAIHPDPTGRAWTLIADDARLTPHTTGDDGRLRFPVPHTSPGGFALSTPDGRLDVLLSVDDQDRADTLPPSLPDLVHQWVTYADFDS